MFFSTFYLVCQLLSPYPGISIKHLIPFICPTWHTQSGVTKADLNWGTAQITLALAMSAEDHFVNLYRMILYIPWARRPFSVWKLVKHGPQRISRHHHSSIVSASSPDFPQWRCVTANCKLKQTLFPPHPQVAVGHCFIINKRQSRT